MAEPSAREASRAQDLLRCSLGALLVACLCHLYHLLNPSLKESGKEVENVSTFSGKLVT